MKRDVLAQYDARTIALHWIMALLVVGLWCVGQTIDWFPKGTPRVTARSAHIGVGVLLALLLVNRIAWRMTRGAKLPASRAGLVGCVATGTHYVLYALVICTVALGITNSLVRGDNLFDLFRIPSIAPGDKALRASVEGWHELSANVLLGVAALHALAGVVQHVALKDGVLARMWPARRSP